MYRLNPVHENIPHQTLAQNKCRKHLEIGLAICMGYSACGQSTGHAFDVASFPGFAQ